MASINMLNPSSLLTNGRFQHATCGMAKDTVEFLRASVQQDKAKNANTASLSFARTLVNRIAGVNAAVIVAPPVGAITCYSLNNGQEYSNIEALDVILWFLLDPTNIDSKQTTFIKYNIPQDVNFIMKSLYRIVPNGEKMNFSAPSQDGVSLLQPINEHSAKEEEEMIALNPQGQVIDSEELEMLRKANMLSSVTFVKNKNILTPESTSLSTTTTTHDDDGDEAEIKEWVEKVREMINRPEYQIERSLPCQVIPGLYLSSKREASSCEILRSNKITHVFSCVNDPRNPKECEKARKRCIDDANVESYLGIWSEDEEGYDMLGQHFEQFESFVHAALCSEVGIGACEGNNKRILVHCNAGVNRSGLLVVAYAMKSLRLSLLDALQMGLEARGPLLWNRYFQTQLVKFARSEGLPLGGGDA
jgi:hypothetical protein